LGLKSNLLRTKVDNRTDCSLLRSLNKLCLALTAGNVYAGVVMVGFVEAISLLLRHWGAIERYHQPTPQEDLTTPLLQVGGWPSCTFVSAE